jgi:ribosomal protein S18 acetylase RimI-like enzyme
MEIREAKQLDVDSIVKIHCDAFKNFFLTSLGSAFLKFYYHCFIDNNETVVLCAVDSGRIVGFTASSTKSKGFNSRLIRSNLMKFGLLSIKLLFTSTKSLIRLMKNLTKKGDYVRDNEDYAELYSIAVIQDAQGKGVGKQLLAALEKSLKKQGVERVSLTTDYFDNKPVVNFYMSMGYDVFYEFDTYPCRKMYRLIKSL